MRARAMSTLAAFLLVAPPLAAAAERVSFRPLDIVVNSGNESLAAYQVEVTYDNSRVKIVGVEGGGAKGWNPAPYYDGRGMTAGRIVIAAFVADDKHATTGRTRVARLHLRVEGEGDPELSIRLVTAARPGGERIEAEVGLVEPEKKGSGK